ncbi:MAG TPA: hypothetical protein VNW26_07220 [Steroidobacteraceae bacterium]|nr:hypothetical protein [Steroidobacteraceae bacterium]
MSAPLCVPLQEEACGTEDFAPLAPVDRGQRAAEIGANSLAHLDDRQHGPVQADQIELAGFATQVLRHEL